MAKANGTHGGVMVEAMIVVDAVLVSGDGGGLTIVTAAGGNVVGPQQPETCEPPQLAVCPAHA